MSSGSASPDPEAGAVSETGQRPRSARRIPRSCHLCNRRKVRCDKKEPCTPCARSGKECVFPPAGRGPRRHKKTVMADMASRISSLEQSLGRAADGADGADGHGHLPRTPASLSVHSPAGDRSAATTATPSGTGEKRNKDDILFQKGASSQYFNEILLSRVMEEERDIQSVLASPDTNPQPVVPSSFNPLGILSAPSSSHTPSSFHPPKAQAQRLFSAYVENVEDTPGLKVLHIPTDEIRIYRTMDNPAAAAPENLALCFGVYYAGLTALGDAEANVILGGQDKTAGLAQAKAGIEQALARSDFLDRPTLTALQAVAIYLSALRVHNRGKGIWVLNGLAIRVAQSMGLHWDGERLGLTPFQSEMRRRVWWHFVGRDGRAGEDYGLQSTVNLSHSCDIAMALNVDDADLHPDMTELPAERKGWTPMTSSLINVDIYLTLQKLSALAASASPPDEEVRRRIVAETTARVEGRLRHCNGVIPRQRITMLISRFVLRKLDLITRQQWQLQRCPSERELSETFTTEENLVEALDTMEMRVQPQEDEMLRPFLWSTRAFPQYHITLYILWHLCAKPLGPSVERAWRVVDSVYFGDLRLGGPESLGPKEMVLRALKSKAEAVREQVRRSGEAAASAPAGVGGGSSSSVQSAPAAGGGSGGGLADGAAPWEYPLGQAGGFPGLDLNINGVVYPAWETLVQEFQLDGDNLTNLFWQ